MRAVNLRGSSALATEDIDRLLERSPINLMEVPAEEGEMVFYEKRKPKKAAPKKEHGNLWAGFLRHMLYKASGGKIVRIISREDEDVLCQSCSAINGVETPRFFRKHLGSESLSETVSALLQIHDFAFQCKRCGICVYGNVTPPQPEQSQPEPTPIISPRERMRLLAEKARELSAVSDAPTERREVSHPQERPLGKQKITKLREGLFQMSLFDLAPLT